MNIHETLNEQVRRAQETGSRSLSSSDSGVLAKDQREAYLFLRSQLDPRFRDYLNRNHSESWLDTLFERDVRHDVTEVLRSDDAIMLFRRVVQDVLLEPEEPALVGIDLLFRETAISTGSTVIEIFLTDGITAQFVGENEPLRDNSLDWEKARQEVRIMRAGVQVAITETMIEDSEWDLMGMHIRAAGAALRRLREEYLWTIVQNGAQTVFSNTAGVNSIKGATTGIGSTGTANQTMTQLDLVDLMAELVNYKMNPTDFGFHPLAWSGFLKDPLLRELLMLSWPTGQMVPTPDNSVRLPFAMQAHMLPFLTSNVETKAPSDAVTTSVIMLDRNNSAVILRRQNPTPKDWVDPVDDTVRMKWTERYGVGLKHGGRGVVQAVGVSSAANYGPVPLVRDISA